MKCFACKKELPDEKYRDQYETIRECECGALNHVKENK
jgi:hypothetical protein